VSFDSASVGWTWMSLAVLAQTKWTSTSVTDSHPSPLEKFQCNLCLGCDVVKHRCRQGSSLSSEISRCRHLAGWTLPRRQSVADGTQVLPRPFATVVCHLEQTRRTTRLQVMRQATRSCWIKMEMNPLNTEARNPQAIG
jgi:hypothetical protein